MARRTTAQSRPAAPSDKQISPWVAVIIAGFLARIVVAYCSIGSDDAAMFWSFANHVSHRGLESAYAENREFNHPPLSGLAASGLLWVTEKLHGRATPTDPSEAAIILAHLATFTFLFKLPAIAADGLVCWLLYRIWRQRAGTRFAWTVAGGWAWALGPILISSYHGNTDSIYAALSLAAVWLLMTVPRRPLAAGLVLGAAINVKLIPVLLIPAFVLHLMSRRELTRFAAGLIVCAIPFVPALYWDWFVAEQPAFTRNVLKYTPMPNAWGFAVPLTVGQDYPPKPGSDDLLLAFKNNGRFLILLLVVAWTFLWRWRGLHRDLYLGTAVIYTIFLVFAPGFGVQYLAIVAPLLFATGPRWLALSYGLASGLCAGSAYLCYLEPDFPLFSKFREYFPPVVVVFGVIAWGLLVAFLLVSTRHAVRRTGNDRGDLSRAEGQ